MYKVDFAQSSARELKKLPSHVQERIRYALESLRRDPFSELIRFRKIKGYENLYRIRLGDYRIVYEVIERKLLIIVIRTGHRSDVYRNL
jgi:mRNA interferase RelE/StbE